MSTQGLDADSYAAKTVKNVAWLGGTQFIRQFVAIGTTVVLARFLSPTDYGIFAMTLFVNELAQLFIDFGIGSALMQRKQVDNILLSTCFWVNLLFGAVAAATVVLIGPFAADYFNQPMVAHLLLVSALNLALSALAVLPQALLARQLAFNHIAVGTTLGSLIGAAATVALAASGAGIWSLVLQPLIGTAVNLLYLVWRARWWPALVFRLDSVKGVLGFSSQVLLSNLVNHVTRNLQQLIVAPVIGASAMGLLSMAQTVAWLPVAQFTSAAVRAIYPVLARIHDSAERMTTGMRRTFEVVAMLAFPVLFGLGLLADDLVPVVFGRQWAATAPLVSVLCVVSLFQCISFLSGSALLASGRATTNTKLSLASLPIVALVLWLVRDSSILVVTAGLSGAHMIVSVLTLHFALKSVTGGWAMLAGALVRPITCSVLMAVVLWLAKLQLSAWSVPLRLWSLVALGAVVYLVCTWVINRRAFDELLRLLRRKS